VVTGDGQSLRCEAGEQPDLTQIFVGSEGTLGFITEATLRVNPLPEHRTFRAYEFPSVAAGCDGMRRVMQLGLRPAVLRLYDQADSLLARASGQGQGSPGLMESLSHRLSEQRRNLLQEAKHALTHAALRKAGFVGRVVENVLPRLSRGCLAIVGFEGEPTLVDGEAELCHEEFLRCGARDLGEAPGLAWYRKRYAVSYKQSPLYAGGGFADTMEVAATWDKLLPLYQGVRAALTPMALLLAHFSHAYPEGCSIYFTFAAAADGRAKSDNLYEEIWRRGLSAVVRAGGTISHHHGVGLSKAAFMAEEHRAALSVYRQLKGLMDPDDILNPGKMGL
jgi:alkyldihydroxyacetonephosphate synthase